MIDGVMATMQHTSTYKYIEAIRILTVHLSIVA